MFDLLFNYYKLSFRDGCTRNLVFIDIHYIKWRKNMGFLKNMSHRMGIMGELLQFFLENKWWWLTPMIFVLLIFGLLIIFAQSSAVAPFIYTLF